MDRFMFKLTPHDGNDEPVHPASPYPGDGDAMLLPADQLVRHGCRRTDSRSPNVMRVQANQAVSRHGRQVFWLVAVGNSVFPARFARTSDVGAARVRGAGPAWPLTAARPRRIYTVFPGACGR
jgi:hypothetical protein